MYEFDYEEKTKKERERRKIYLDLNPDPKLGGNI